jgi:carboxylesterase
MSAPYELVNAHLEGGPFFWEAGPVGILLCHGYTATSAEVRPLAQALFQHGYTVAGPLLPGHGTSPEDANQYTWQDWAAAVEKVYAKLEQQCQKVVVGGESLGGLLALYTAFNHPKAAAVMTYAPALRSSSLLTRLVVEVLKNRVAMRPKKFDPPVPLPLWQGYAHDPVHAASQLFRIQVQVERCLEDIHQPLLIVQGKKDTAVYPQVPGLIASRVKSQVKVIHWMPESGHCVLLDQEREQVFEITLAFLDQVLNL